MKLKLEKIANFFKNVVRGMSYMQIYQRSKELGDIFPCYLGKSGQQKDAQALYEDWRKVGQDIQYPLDNFKK